MQHISEMCRSLSINLYLRPCSIAIYGEFYLYRLYLFRPFLVSKLYKPGLWNTHYILEMWGYTNIVYIGVYLVFTYREKLFSTVCYFLSYFAGQLISHVRNTGKSCISELLVFSFMGSSIPTFQYFFSFFHVVCKLLKSFLVTFCRPVNCMCWLFDFRDIQKLKH